MQTYKSTRQEFRQEMALTRKARVIVFNRASS
jgi:hypothetical protein